MKKYFSIFILIILLSFKVFGQAQIDIPFTATDGIDSIDYLRVGLDTTATNGIDPNLGEWELPPLPPFGIFISYFDLAPYIGESINTYRDYRNVPSFPYTGSKEHTLQWQLSSASTTFDVIYNFPFGVWANLKDQFGGILYNISISDSGSISLPYWDQQTQAILTMYYDNVIPVQLIRLNASVIQNENAVQLNWTTATETNNSGFEIQKTSPLPSPYQGEGGEAGRGWEKIGFVPGFGTTTEPKTYSFVDEDVKTGTYKYRLKQIDFDGSFEYSNEIEVEVDFTPNEFVLYQNYPNPFNPSTVIRFEIPGQARNDNVLVTLKVYDILGNEVAILVNEEKQPGVYEIEFDASTLTSGMYLYKLQAGAFVQVKKMVLIK